MQTTEPKNATFIDYVKGELDIWTFHPTNEIFLNFIENQVVSICGMDKTVLFKELDAEMESKSMSAISRSPSGTYNVSSSGSVNFSDLSENKNTTASKSTTKVDIAIDDKYYVPHDFELSQSGYVVAA